MEAISGKIISASVVIRLAEINDASEIAELDAKIFKYNADIKDKVKELAFQQKSYVAVDDDIGAIVGFVLCEFKKFGCHIACAIPKRYNVIEVESFAVEESHRSNGIGGSLFDAVICQAYQDASVNFVILTTNVGNTVALKIYLARGFEIVKFVEGYYKELKLWADDPNAFVLAKRIYDDEDFGEMLTHHTSACFLDELVDHPY